MIAPVCWRGGSSGEHAAGGRGSAGNVPRRKAEFTTEQLTKVAAAWRDGERG
jgi:hypothetical protein